MFDDSQLFANLELRADLKKLTIAFPKTVQYTVTANSLKHINIYTEFMKDFVVVNPHKLQ